MVNFKAGDVVERKPHHNNDLFLHKVGPGPHVVTAVSTKGHWLCINDWTDSGTDLLPWSSGNFALAQGQDDPLPPAPESVLYIGLQQHVHRRLQVKVFTPADGGSVVDLHIGGGELGDGKSCTLDPDAALQLAHDLNRMANEIKRKGKQQ